MVFLPVLVAAATAAAGPDHIEVAKRREATIALLQQREYFKDATCGEVISAALIGLGLPAIGEKRTVKGRKDFDRGGEKEDLPRLMDSVETDGGTLTKISSRATNDRPPSWELVFVREKKARDIFKLTTTFKFASSMQKGRQVCDVSTVGFKVGEAEKGKENPEIKPDCLDMFLVAEEKKTGKNEKSPLELIGDFMEKDCAFSLHYSRAAKALLTSKDKK